MLGGSPAGARHISSRRLWMLELRQPPSLRKPLELPVMLVQGPRVGAGDQPGAARLRDLVRVELRVPPGLLAGGRSREDPWRHVDSSSLPQVERIRSQRVDLALQWLHASRPLVRQPLRIALGRFLGGRAQLGPSGLFSPLGLLLHHFQPVVLGTVRQAGQQVGHVGWDCLAHATQPASLGEALVQGDHVGPRVQGNTEGVRAHFNHGVPRRPQETGLINRRIQLRQHHHVTDTKAMLICRKNGLLCAWCDCCDLTNSLGPYVFFCSLAS
mmetsp:Transcript_11303/g.24850  ORF Transcript_11303/g.24850 Transcript_11303/m.24850 type:complete len:270 (-) Transcript_11303:451-1260(-)